MITNAGYTHKSELNWYYNSESNHSNSWTGAPEFAEFCAASNRINLLWQSQGLQDTKLRRLLPGDILQYGSAGAMEHTMFVTSVDHHTVDRTVIHQHGAAPSREVAYLKQKDGARFYMAWRPFPFFGD
jgi:hypothetical protein